MTEQIAITEAFALLGGVFVGGFAYMIFAILWAEWRDRDE